MVSKKKFYFLFSVLRTPTCNNTIFIAIFPPPLLSVSWHGSQCTIQSSAVNGVIMRLRICISFATLAFSIGHYGFAIEGDDPAICTARIVHHIVSLGLGEFSHLSCSQFKYTTELKWSVNTLMSSLHMSFLSISSPSVEYCPSCYGYMYTNVS